MRQGLQWRNPWSDFLTINGVIFVTFYQEMIISILVNWHHENQHTDTNLAARVSQLQNGLICLEMLLFSLTHWCVFPIKEWQKDFTPKTMAKPDIELQDFVSDVNHVSRSQSWQYGGPHGQHFLSIQKALWPFLFDLPNVSKIKRLFWLTLSMAIIMMMKMDSCCHLVLSRILNSRFLHF